MLGLPSWSSGWESALQCRGRRFDPWSKISHASGQPSTHAQTTDLCTLEPMRHTQCMESMYRDERPHMIQWIFHMPCSQINWKKKTTVPWTRMLIVYKERCPWIWEPFRTKNKSWLIGYRTSAEVGRERVSRVTPRFLLWACKLVAHRQQWKHFCFWLRWNIRD